MTGDAEPAGDEELERFAAFVGKADSFLDQLAHRHLCPGGRLLA